MTPRERVLCSLAWREPDRVPIRIYLTPEVAERLREHFGGRDILECLGVDFRGVGPAYKGKVKEPHDGITYDIWGSGYREVRHGSAGSYSEAVVLPLADLKTMDDVERYPWPSPDDYDYSVIPEQCERLKDFAISLGGAGDPDILNGVSRGSGERLAPGLALVVRGEQHAPPAPGARAPGARQAQEPKHGGQRPGAFRRHWPIDRGG